MKGSSPGRPQIILLALGTAGIIVGGGYLAFYAGEALATISLVFGALFFAFAARYYVATISVLLAPSSTANNGRNGQNLGNGGNGVTTTPMVSVHLALFNEERVVDRVLTACTNLDYPNYEVVVVDDSNDGTVKKLRGWILDQIKTDRRTLKIYHRGNREGFKGGALNEALKHTDPRAEYVVVFDADFIPDPDILKRFLAYFNRHGPNGTDNGNGNGNGGKYSNGKLAAVQGYQWHTLNRAENWLTRGVSCEFSGNYMVDRTFQEVTGAMKMVAGSVYMIRADLLRKYGWSGSITEDWELTLRLYENGHKVLYTPLIQAPAECPSTLGKLIRQRMRWAEGHTYNVKRHFLSVVFSSKLGIREKLEFLYFAPYYLQSAFLILGTFSWLSSDILLGAKLPFWTATLGWALVFTNLLALPLMSLTGLFLEKRARKDYRGIASQFLLTYALAPYQAFASIKGLVEPVEGSWVRTFKSGRLAGFPGKLEPRKLIKNVLPPKRRVTASPSKLKLAAVVGLAALVLVVFVRGQVAASSPQPAFYFYNQASPPGYQPYPTPPGSSFMMHPSMPAGHDARSPIGNSQGSGPDFFSDPAPGNIPLPFGASVSIHIWVDGGNWSYSGGSGTGPLWATTTTHTSTSCNCGNGNLKFRIDFYDPANNTILNIPGAGLTEVIPLQPGLHYYQASWGNIAQGKVMPKGDTLLATIWCPNCQGPVKLLFNSQSHPSNIDFPITVPENSLSLAPFALVIPAIAGVTVEYGLSRRQRGDGYTPEGGMHRVQTTLIFSAAFVLLTLPLVITFNSMLTSLASYTGLDKAVSIVVPYEAGAVADMLRGVGLAAGSGASNVWLAGGFIPLTAFIDWNCAGWQGFALFGLTSVFGLPDVRSNWRRVAVLVLGLAGVFAVNVMRIFIVVLLGYFSGYQAALIFHNYGGTVMTLAWLLVFWSLALRGENRKVPDEP